jgi:ABC-type ATPase involved in cell division
MAPGAGPVFRWRGLTASGPEPVAVPDLEIAPGEIALVLADDDRVLASLGLAASGQAEAQGDVRWFGRERPHAGDFEDILKFYREIAYVGPDSRPIANRTLMETLCFELEYNQMADRGDARRLALECLETLGLTPMANLSPEKLAGPAGYVAMMALAVSRRPGFLVLERPMTLFRPLFFHRLMEALRANARPTGQAALILGRKGLPYRPGDFDRVVPLDGPGPHPTDGLA